MAPDDDPYSEDKAVTVFRIEIDRYPDGSHDAEIQQLEPPGGMGVVGLYPTLAELVNNLGSVLEMMRDER